MHKPQTILIIFIILIGCASKSDNGHPQVLSEPVSKNKSFDVCLDSNGNIYSLIRYIDSDSGIGSSFSIIQYDSSNVISDEMIIDDRDFFRPFIEALGNRLVISGSKSDSQIFSVEIFDWTNGTDCIWEGNAGSFFSVATKDSSSIFVGGYELERNFDENAFVARLNDDCEVHFERLWDCDERCRISSIAASGNRISACGSYSGHFRCLNDQYSQGSSDAFVMTLDESGKCEWIRSLSGSSTINAASIVFDAHENVYAAGIYYGDMSVGDLSFQSRGGYDIYIAKFSPRGETIWIRTIGTNESDLASFLRIDDESNLFITGRVGTDYDFTPNDGVNQEYLQRAFVAKYDSEGSILNVYGWQESEVPTGITSNNGEIYITCPFGFETEPIIVTEYMESDSKLSTVQDAALIRLVYRTE